MTDKELAYMGTPRTPRGVIRYAFGYNYKVLITKCERVDDFSNLDGLLQDMEKVLGNNGMGLSAPQIGDLRRVCIVTLGKRVKEFVNPEIIRSSGIDVAKETCLSLPFYNIDVPRAEEIVVKYQNKQGQEHVEVFDGKIARVLQHEIDHLDGILIKDK